MTLFMLLAVVWWIPTMASQTGFCEKAPDSLETEILTQELSEMGPSDQTLHFNNLHVLNK